jgi:hypothetical protein
LLPSAAAGDEGREAEDQEESDALAELAGLTTLSLLPPVLLLRLRMKESILRMESKVLGPL